MSFENEPKSIEDYKDVVKILKLKIIKQNKKIQELQQRNKTFEEQINSVTLKGQDLQFSSRAMIQLQNDVKITKEQKELELNTLKGKVAVMNIYSKGLKKMGISPQSVFRIADFAYKNYVQSDYFRQILANMKLNLSQKQISSLIFIFDDSYSGLITRDEYLNSLCAYKIGVEESYHQYIHECIFKLSQMLHQDKINLMKFYEDMEGKAKSKIGTTNKKMIDLGVFEEQIKKTYGNKMSEKEIVASFNAIDLQSQGYLEKSNFLYTITSFINKLLSGDETLSNKKTQNQWSQQKPHMSQVSQGKSHVTEPYAKNIGDVAIQQGGFKKSVQSYMSPQKNPVNESYFSVKQFGDMVMQDISAHEKERKQNTIDSDFQAILPSLYAELVMFNFDRRMTLKTFKKLAMKANKGLKPEFLNGLFRLMDSSLKGSVFFNQLFNFYLEHAKDTEMILRLLGRYFDVSDLNAEKFWFMYGLDPEAQISKNKFLQIMKKNFDSREEGLWEKLWDAMARGKDSYSVEAIVDKFRKYQW